MANPSPFEEGRSKYLIGQYNAGLLSVEEEFELEQFIEQGLIPLEALEDLYALDQKLEQALNLEPQKHRRISFYQMLEEQQKLLKRPSNRLSVFWNRYVQQPALQWAVAALLILGVIGIGRWIFADSSNPQMEQLATELNEMKEMMLLTMLEKRSTTERLKAVSLSQDIGDASEKVTNALLYTLRTDQNVNVRLAALNALLPYTDQATVRQGLIEAIAIQESPLVQIAMAELMVTLQEKRSIKPLQDMLKDEKIPEEVKADIKRNLDILL